MLLVQRVPGLMVKPEVQNLSQKVAGELAQRAAARLIRELFLSSDPLIYEDNQLGSTVEKTEILVKENPCLNSPYLYHPVVN